MRRHAKRDSLPRRDWELVRIHGTALISLSIWGYFRSPFVFRDRVPCLFSSLGKVKKGVRSAYEPGARFSKAPEIFRARKAIFSSSVSKDEEVYTPETSFMKRTSFHIKNLRIE